MCEHVRYGTDPPNLICSYRTVNPIMQTTLDWIATFLSGETSSGCTIAKYMVTRFNTVLLKKDLKGRSQGRRKSCGTGDSCPGSPRKLSRARTLLVAVKPGQGVLGTDLKMYRYGYIKY